MQWFNSAKYKYSELYTDLLEDYRQLINPIIRVPKTIIRWIFVYLIPFILGAMGEDLIQHSLTNDNLAKLLDLGFWRQYWFSIPLFGLFILGLIWRNRDQYTDIHLDRIYYALRWFSMDMGFQSKKNADIRCTIWVPVETQKDNSPIRLKQIVDYVPQKSVLSKHNFRINKQAGRIFPVSHFEGSVEQPIGILGYCAVDSVRKNDPGIYVEKIPEGIDFVEYMVENWNFSERKAIKLTLDRRSYLCLAMMDTSNSRLLGVIYCDSRDPEALTKEVGENGKGYLPYFAQLLTE